MGTIIICSVTKNSQSSYLEVKIPFWFTSAAEAMKPFKLEHSQIDTVCNLAQDGNVFQWVIKPPPPNNITGACLLFIDDVNDIRFLLGATLELPSPQPVHPVARLAPLPRQWYYLIQPYNFNSWSMIINEFLYFLYFCLGSCNCFIIWSYVV